MKYLFELIKEFNSKLCKLFRSNIFSFSFAVLFITYLIFIFPRTYRVNDNIGILFNAEHGFLSEFVSYFYMKLLYHLYQMGNEIPWYGLTLYSIHVLSLFIFIKSLAKIKNFETFLIPFLIIYLYFYISFITQLDYTSTSIMIGANSLFAFLIYLNNKEVSILYVLGLGVLFSFSFMVRIYGTFAVLVYVLPIIGLFFVYKYKQKQYFAIFFIPFLLLSMGENVARTYFTSPEYQQYHEFNRLRGKLHGLPILSANQNNYKILKENNWTKNDYERFYNWMFFDERKYNTRTLSNIFKYSVLKEENKIQKYLNLYFYKLNELLNKYDYKWYVYFLLLVFILVIYEFSWFALVITCCYLLYVISGSVYLDIFYRFPPRIGYPIFLMVTSFVILLIFSLLPQKSSAKNTNHNIFVTTFTLGIFLLLLNININVFHKFSTNLPFKLSINRLQSSLYQGKIFYVQPVEGLRLEKMDPLTRYHFNFELIVTATNFFSPFFYKQLEKLGVKEGYNMIPAMINNPNAFVIVKKNSTFMKLLLNYIEENHQIKCKAIAVDRLANGSIVYKLRHPSKVVDSIIKGSVP
jgi:hypothetical protein